MSWPEGLHPRSLQGRLILALAGGLGSLLALLFLLLDQAVERQLEASLDAQLLDRAHAIAALVAGGQHVDALLPEFRARGHTGFYTVRAADGSVLLHSASTNGAILPPPPEAPAAAPRFHDLRLPDGHRGRAIALASHRSASPGAGPVVVSVAIEREDTDAVHQRVHLALMIGFLLATLGAAALASIVVHRGLRPLLRLGARAGTAQPGQARPQFIEASLPAELRPLAEALDGAFSRLDRLVEQERRFAHDVAHELRTPLAEMRSSIELARRSGEAARIDAAFAASLAAIGRMQRAVDGLLALASHAAGRTEPQSEPLELMALVHAQCRALERRAQAREMGFSFDGPDECWISADPALLERILANLLQNAVNHAPAGTSIRCHLEPGSAAWLEIANAAPGLVPADLDRLGERFWRKQPIGTGDAPGGLGLALARTLAEVLGLQLDFRLAAGELVARLGPLRPL